MMKYLFFVLVVVVGLVLATFGIQNSTSVSIRFLQWESGNVPLGLIMLGSALIGMLLVRVVELPGRVRHRRDTRQLWDHLYSITAGGAARAHATCGDASPDEMKHVGTVGVRSSHAAAHVAQIGVYALHNIILRR